MPDDDLTQDPVQDQQPPVDAGDKGAPAAPASVSREEFDTLVRHSRTLEGQLVEAGKRIGLIDRVAAMLTGKPEDTLTKEERAVVTELQRLMPHILPNAKFLEEIPKVKDVVDRAAGATAETLVNAAFAVQLDLQQSAGFPIDDPKLNRLVAGSIRDYINEDKTRQARFWRGDRAVVQEAFDDAKSLIATSTRVAGKQTLAETVKHRPKSSAPVSGGTPGAGQEGLNLMDPKSVRAAMKAALTQ